jgi:GTPase SAR1 family protein
VNYSFIDHDLMNSLATQYYRSACAVLLVYDVSNRKSFEKIPYWMSQVKDNAESGIQRILIANKTDLTYEREVSKKEGEEFANSQGIKYVETSAKTDKNINLAFENLALDVYLSVKNGNIPADSDGSKGVKLGDYYVEETKLPTPLGRTAKKSQENNQKLNRKKLKRGRKDKNNQKENEGSSGCCN